jgi:uncharacterized membrane protein
MACMNHPDRESTARCVTCAAELCDECRVEADGKNYCRKDAPEAATPPGPPPPPPPASSMAAPPMTPPAAGVDDPSQEQPVMAALAYIIGIIFSVIILVTDMKKSRYMRFHAFQSLFFCLFGVVLGIALAIISQLPVIGLIALIVGPLVSLAMLVLAILLAVKAYNKQEMTLPVITQMARDQADKMKI